MNRSETNHSKTTAYIGTRFTTLDFGDTSLEIEPGRRYNLEQHSEVDRAVKIGALELLELNAMPVSKPASQSAIKPASEKTKSEGEGDK